MLHLHQSRNAPEPQPSQSGWSRATRARLLPAGHSFSLDRPVALSQSPGELAASRHPTTDLPTVGPYKVLEPLGEGGMGIVYRARHLRSDRAIALKTVKVPAPIWLASLRREIQALTRIRHPGVVGILDHGIDQGRPWYAMELLEGESVRHFGQRIWSSYRIARSAGERFERTEEMFSTTEAVLLEEHHDSIEAQTADSTPPPSFPATGKVPAAAGQLDRVLRVMRRVCAAIGYLHGEGFVNCDLKPENVIIVGDQPVLIDFGLSTRHPGRLGREELEAHRSRMGTLPYMSPEVIGGDFADARADLYAFGCVLYELVCGRPPFSGSPSVLLAHHLNTTPTPPSELVDGLPDRLEKTILRLLEKQLNRRFGYADEVATILAEISGDLSPLPDAPPARSYLYRSRFVGREEQLKQVMAAQYDAARGKGALVLVGGESGVGKTRFAMEVTRFAADVGMRVVTSEASVLPFEQPRTHTAPPLSAFRPLLQAIADQCLEGGPDTTLRLLGNRHALLARYEPALKQVPTHDTQVPAIAPSGAEFRKRLFEYLSATLTALAEQQPLMLILDDVGWADELSLAFLQSLSVDYLSQTPVFMLGTYRSEDASEIIRGLVRAPHVQSLMLSRLSADAVFTMMNDMLALNDGPSPFAHFVSRETEGNPFFVAEYLRMAVNERMLFRDLRHSWQVRGETDAEFRQLQLPQSLRDLIVLRLQKLSPTALQVGLAAAVVGREAELNVLSDIAALPEETFVDAVNELTLRQVLYSSAEGRMRFAHDKLQEVAYELIEPIQLATLHGRAAAALEQRLAGRHDADSAAAVVGQHYAGAGKPEPAVNYLRWAANHAQRTHANFEAMRLYQQASEQVDQILQVTTEQDRWQAVGAELLECLGDVTHLVGRREQARAHYEQALQRVAAGTCTSQARLHRKIGKTWETQHRHDDALRCYRSALETLGPNVDTSDDVRDEWLQVQIEQLYLYYWLDRVADMVQLCEVLRPKVQAHGSPSQRARFFQSQMMKNLRRDRYVVNEETLMFAKQAREACEDDPPLPDLPLAQFGYGFALLFTHSLDQADHELQKALTLADRSGDSSVKARCLTYLSVASRMRGMLEETKTFTQRSIDLAQATGTTEYVAAGLANQAWAQLHEGDIEGAATLAQRAIDAWNGLTLVFPFQWLARLPLVAASVKLGDIERAIAATKPLSHPSQQVLPGAVSDELARAVRHWDAGLRTQAQSSLMAALTLLEQTAYH